MARLNLTMTDSVVRLTCCDEVVAVGEDGKLTCSMCGAIFNLAQARDLVQAAHESVAELLDLLNNLTEWGGANMAVVSSTSVGANRVFVTYRESDQNMIAKMLEQNGQHLVTVHNGHIVALAQVNKPTVATQPAGDAPEGAEVAEAAVPVKGGRRQSK